MTKWLVLMILGMTSALVAPVLAAQEVDAGPPKVASVVSDAGSQVNTPVPVVVPPEGHEIDTIAGIVAHARDGKWLIVIGLVLSLVVTGLKYLAKWGGVSWFGTDRGGAVLVALTSVFGALSTSAIAGKVDWTTFVAALAVTWSAVGGYSWLKKLIWPADKKPAELPAAKTG